jgi:F-type H+-transporting ATPase subunit gamma
MPSLKDIRKRISSVKNTQKITRAMKMVAAAKLRRAQEAAEEARPYANKMEQVISGLATRVDPTKHPLLEQREVEDNALVIVITSNRGLCGGYNTNVFRALEKFARDREVSGISFEVAVVGRKAKQYFRNHRLETAQTFDEIIGDITFAGARRIAEYAIDAFVSGEYDNVYLAYNNFISAISYDTQIEALLPLTLEELENEEADAEAISEYIFEPDEEELLATMLPAHIENRILHALLEAEASEHGARMTAMDNATNNANDMIESLTLQYNRARQAYITKELVEIVSGAEALEG